MALQVVFTFWSQVGGQYHLDLMFWPWKFGLSIAAALLIVGITGSLAGADGIPRRVLLYFFLLTVIVAIAGLVTFYYHLHEPADDEQDNQDQPTRVSLLPAGYHTRQEFGPRTIG